MSEMVNAERAEQDARPEPLRSTTRDDPWALTPAEQADLDKRLARRRAEAAAIPTDPPF